ncbi:MAG: hypothetical protein IPL35_06200 [Sphingobacteriales bacterium]|nr:hypothetical protein [Sphingobacteriales bacterium]
MNPPSYSFFKNIADFIARSKSISLLLVVLVLVFTGFTFVQQNNTLCTDMNIRIKEEGTRNVQFLNIKQIENLVLDTLKKSPIHQRIKDINLHAIKSKLEQHYYIQNATVHLGIHGALNIDVSLQKPIIRIINQHHDSFYITNTGFKIPCSTKFTARVPVITNYQSNNKKYSGALQNEQEQELWKFISILHKNTFIYEITDQIDMSNKDNILLIPFFKQQVVELGGIEDIQIKLRKLQVFYEQVVFKEAQWNTIKRIKAQYAGNITVSESL